MKKIIAISAAAAIVAMAGSAFAATASDTLTVSADVVKACTATKSADIAFGDLDPVNDPATLSTATKSGATRGGITIKCTQGTNYTLGATTTAMANGANSIPFAAVLPTVPANDGVAAGKTYTVDASVIKTDYSTKPAGAYSGSMIVTVTY